MKSSILLRWPVYRSWVASLRFLKEAGIDPRIFVASSALAFAAALAEGAFIGLLIPTLRGILEKNYAFVNQIPVLKTVVNLLPGTLPQSSKAVFTLLVLMVFFFGVTKNALCYFQSLVTRYQVLSFAAKLRGMIYARYLSFGKMFFDHASFGHLHQVIITYVTQLSQTVSVFNGLLYQMFALFVYLGIGLFISWKLMLFSMIVFPVSYFVLQNLIKRIRRSSEAWSEAYSELGKRISNALSSILLVKAYTNEEKEKKYFNFTNARVRDFYFSIEKKQLLVTPMQEVFTLCMILLVVGVMAVMLTRGKAGGVAEYMVFFFVMRRAAQSFSFLGEMQSMLASVRGPIKEIRQVFNDQDKFFVPEGDKVLTGLKAKIEFRDLDFSYVEGRQILDHFNLTVKKGETVAIVGATGSGKTTLINLLMRFYDNPPGSIFIDGTDTREFTTESLRAKMALVSQETFLLNGSFTMNLLYGLDREISSEEVEEILQKARLTPVVKRIGLEALVGERGVKLSGGERQRVAIARAMLKNPEILLLDEATSSLDSTTEKLIQEALAEVTVNKTVIVIAHRLSTVQNADRIVVLEKGRKVEEGTFSELLANKESHFHYYWQNQTLSEKI